VKYKCYDKKENFEKRVQERLKGIDLKNELDIDFNSTTFPNRSFSVPKFSSQHCEILINSDINDDIKEIIREICMEYSDDEMQAIINDMPIVNWYAQDNKETLKGVSIIWRDHFLEENIGLLNAFVTMGVNPNDILALDKGDQTQHRFEIRETFKKMGFHVEVLDNKTVMNDENNEIELNKIKLFIESRRDKKMIVIDDGAILSKIVNNRVYPNIKAVIELTEMGLRRINKFSNQLLYPVLNVAKTTLKRKIIYPEIANSIFTRIIQLLGGEKIVGRTILLCGYGDMGEIIAERFRSFGIKIIIYDSDVMKLIIAGEKGFNTYRNSVNAVKKEKPFLVIGSSGYKSITDELIKHLPDNSYVTAGATADLSVFVEYENTNKAIVNKISNYGTQYYIYDKHISVLGNGRSVNLFNSESIPNKSNDIFKAAIVVAVNKAINENIELKNQVNLNIVEDWILESKILDVYYDMYLNKE